MDNVKASLVVMSHLSDIQESLNSLWIIEKQDKKDYTTRMNFVKYLLVKYNGNLDIRIDPDKDFEEFLTKHPVR